MKTFLLIILAGVLVASFTNASAQTSFISVESKLKTVKNKDLTAIFCQSESMSVKFQLKREVTASPQNNFVTVDGQTIQVMTLKFSGYKGDLSSPNMDNQKQLLDEYSKYELAYFSHDLGIEVINPNNQWVITKAKGWFIWYFRVGKVPVQAAKPTKIQLFASTVVGDKILIINAPIFADDDFTKAGLIVNDLMETLSITQK